MAPDPSLCPHCGEPMSGHVCPGVPVVTIPDTVIGRRGSVFVPVTAKVSCPYCQKPGGHHKGSVVETAMVCLWRQWEQAVGTPQPFTLDNLRIQAAWVCVGAPDYAGKTQAVRAPRRARSLQPTPRPCTCGGAHPTAICSQCQAPMCDPCRATYAGRGCQACWQQYTAACSCGQTTGTAMCIGCQHPICATCAGTFTAGTCGMCAPAWLPCQHGYDPKLCLSCAVSAQGPAVTLDPPTAASPMPTAPVQPAPPAPGQPRRKSKAEIKAALAAVRD